MMLHWLSCQKGKGVWWWGAQNKTKKITKRKTTSRAVYEQRSVKHHKTVPAKSSAQTEALILSFWLQGLHRAATAGLPQPDCDPWAKTAPALSPFWHQEQAARSFPLHLCVKDGPHSTAAQQAPGYAPDKLCKQVWNSAIIVCCGPGCSFPLSFKRVVERQRNRARQVRNYLVLEESEVYSWRKAGVNTGPYSRAHKLKTIPLVLPGSENKSTDSNYIPPSTLKRRLISDRGSWVFVRLHVWYLNTCTTRAEKLRANKTLTTFIITAAFLRGRNEGKTSAGFFQRIQHVW